LNHVRYHSWTPPEVALTAADEAGIYLQCENAWANVSNKKLQDYIMQETACVIKRFGNHPSFILVAYGNEPGGVKRRKAKNGNGKAWLKEWVDFVRTVDENRKFYTSAAGWGETENSDYYDIMRGMRVYPWGAGLRATINANPPEFTSTFNETTKKDSTKSYIGHETGQWCVFPDFDEMDLYTGFLKPENFWIFKQNMKENHLFGKWKDFFNASGKLQTLCYKFEIEKLRRTKGCGGYQLLGINDFPGQGTALVGPVNVFWKVKSYTSPEEYRCFNGKTAILAKFTKFIYDAGETVVCDIDISHFAKEPILNTELDWEIKNGLGKTVKSGLEKITEIPLGLSNIVKSLNIPTAGLTVPEQYMVEFAIKDTDIKNHYNIWIYPKEEETANIADIIITDDLKKALANLAEGKKVLFVPGSSNIAQPKERVPVLGFSTIFWNTVWANRQPPTIMGVETDPTHPLFANFPTENFSDYQWWYIINKTSKPLWLDNAPTELKPIVNIIDDWFTNRRLALVIEGKVGQGKLLMTSIPIATVSEKSSRVLKQFRNAIIQYMNSDKFNPTQEITEKCLTQLCSPVK